MNVMFSEDRDVIKHLASFQLTSGCLLHLGVGSVTWFEVRSPVVNAAPRLVSDILLGQNCLGLHAVLSACLSFQRELRNASSCS